MGWYDLALELVRHTPTYSPPVASRSLAYLGVAAYESVASGSDKLQSLAGQLNALTPVPQREAGKVYDNAVIINSAMSFFMKDFFSNTSPAGLRTMATVDSDLSTKVSEVVPPDVLARSKAYGQAVGAHIFEWSKNDGGADVTNMGFPLVYKLTKGPSHWVPTSRFMKLQTPLLPAWGQNRTFAIPKITDCVLKPPPPYSEDKKSVFYKQGLEVYNVSKKLTPDQRALAKFWSDDPMLTATPAGHGVAIALQIIKRDKWDLEKSVDVLARAGVGQADAMTGAWYGKFVYDRVRPVTYINRFIDKNWEPILETPSFPEYPSGHSVQAGAAAEVMTPVFGENMAFEDYSGVSDGNKPRKFASLWAAANEAGISRLYGGIHFRAAIENGLAYGKCIGGYTNTLKTWR